MRSVFVDLMVSQPSGSSKFHGGGEFTKTIFRELSAYHPGRIALSVFFDPDQYMDQWVLDLIGEKDIACYCVHSYDEISALPEFQKADAMFAGLLEGVKQLKIPQAMKVVGVYHGYRSLEMPTDKYAPFYAETPREIAKDIYIQLFRKHYFNYKFAQMKGMIDRCSDIIADSEHSKYATRVFFPYYDPAHIHVFYPLLKYVKEEYLQAAVSNDSREKTVLMLGGNRWIKNAWRGAMALDDLFAAGHLPEYNVRIIGGLPAALEKRLKCRERFDLCGYLPPEGLEAAYRSCNFFFYPTLNEGFGSPPLEAMRYGKTCLISAVTSLPEIYRDAVYYCNPYDKLEMKMRLLQAAETKIPTEHIQAVYNLVVKRQEDDTKKLCELIIE